MRDSTAEKLISQATELQPAIKVLPLSHVGEQRSLNGFDTFTPDMHKPATLRDAVARVLDGQADGVT